MRNLLWVVLAIVLWAPSARAQFVAPGGMVPVVANNYGVNGIPWRSDVSVLNINATDTAFVLVVYPEIRNGTAEFEPQVSDTIQVPPNGQVTLSNVLQSRFGLTDTKGALSVLSLDGSPLVVSSRVYTFTQSGASYGQDVRGVLVANRAWAAGLRHDSLYRTNVGVFLPIDPSGTAAFTIDTFDEDGDQVGSGALYFHQAGLQQKSLDAFGVDDLVDGYVVITCSDPSLFWYAYASRVDQISGDGVYRAAVGLESDLQ